MLVSPGLIRVLDAAPDCGARVCERLWTYNVEKVLGRGSCLVFLAWPTPCGHGRPFLAVLGVIVLGMQHYDRLSPFDGQME